MFAPPHNGQVFVLLASCDRATSLIVPITANSHSPTIVTLDVSVPAPIPIPTDISYLPPTRRAPRANIHSCPTYRVRRVFPGYYANRVTAQAHMDCNHTGLSALARDRNKLQGLLVLHTSSDISLLGGNVSRTLLSLPNFLLC
jgi:hypothetical protein